MLTSRSSSFQGIPTLVNRHERDYAIILKEVKGKVEQVSGLTTSWDDVPKYTDPSAR